MSTRREFLHTAALTSLAGLNFSALAQSAGLPIEQVKILYGFPAGSSGDIVARRVGEKMAGTTYTRNVAVVENKPGAGGSIGSALVAKSVSAMALCKASALPWVTPASIPAACRPLASFNVSN